MLLENILRQAGDYIIIMLKHVLRHIILGRHDNDVTKIFGIFLDCFLCRLESRSQIGIGN